MKNFYSPSTGGFYPEDLRADYVRTNTWPADAVEVDAEKETLVRAGLARGESVSFNGSMPVFTPAPLEPVADILARALVDIRKQRAPILATLDGIAGRMYRAGEIEIAQAADDAINGLLDITKLPLLLAATDYAGMKYAVMQRYKELATDAPPVVRAAFVEAIAS